MWYARRDVANSDQPVIQGYFDDEEEAAKAADAILLRNKGDTTLLNFSNSQRKEQENKIPGKTEIKDRETWKRACPTSKTTKRKEIRVDTPLSAKRKRKYEEDSDYEDEPPPRSPFRRKKLKLNGEPIAGPRHGYFGICKMPRSGYEKWQARRRHPKTKKYVTNGVYNTKKEAAQASDAIWLSFKSNKEWDASKLNFSENSENPDFETYQPPMRAKTQFDDDVPRYAHGRSMVNFPAELDEIVAEYSDMDEDEELSEDFYEICSSPEEPHKKARVMKKGSSYIGVQLKNDGRYKVVRIINGEPINGGEFEVELEAAHRSDDMVRKYKASGGKLGGCRLNFPRREDQERMKKMQHTKRTNPKRSVQKKTEKPAILTRKKSQYVGVEFAGDGKWRAQRCINGERVVSKKIFTCDMQAARASDDLVRTYATNTYATLNFPTSEERRAKAIERKTSKYKGVHYTKKGLWRASRSIGGKKMMGGEFENELDAARASDALARKHGSTGTLNFPDERCDDEYTPIPHNKSKVKPAAKKVAATKSKYIGVTWNWRTRKWSAERAILGNKVHGGHWSDEEEAARASDRIARENQYFRGRFNFPTTEDEDRKKKKRKKIEGPCPYFGVSIRGDRYYVSRTIRGKHYSGGSHDDEMTAVRASDDIVRREGAHGICKINMPTTRDLQLIEDHRRSKFEQQKCMNSKFVGVTWKPNENGWAASRMINGIQTYGGTYANEVDAAKASDNLVKENVSHTHKLNFPPDELIQHDFTNTANDFLAVSQYGQKWNTNHKIEQKHNTLTDIKSTRVVNHDPYTSQQAKPQHDAPKPHIGSMPNDQKTAVPRRRSSRYVGVQWSVSHGKWQAERTIDGVKILEGFFDNEMAAVRAADDIIRRERAYHCELNFPTNQEIEFRRRALMSRLKTGFFGVRAGGYGTFHGSRRNAETGETIRSQDCETKEEAARASDEIWKRINAHKVGKAWKLRLNFPDSAGKTVIDLTSEKLEIQKSRKYPQIPMVGNFYGIRLSLGGWEAVRIIEGKFKYNGLHQTMELAARASDVLWKQHGGDPKLLNFPAQQVRQVLKPEKTKPPCAPHKAPIDLTTKSLQDIFNTVENDHLIVA